MKPMTVHEMECALAAIAARIEATRGKERAEWRKFYQEIVAAEGNSQ